MAVELNTHSKCYTIVGAKLCTYVIAGNKFRELAICDFTPVGRGYKAHVKHVLHIDRAGFRKKYSSLCYKTVSGL